VEFAFEGLESPGPDRDRSHLAATLVDVDDKDVAGVNFVERGRLRGALYQARG
jgi:hypothetical protein